MANKRILSIGSELPFIERSITWDEVANIKDFDIVFVNLRGLERTLKKESFQLSHPERDKDNSIKFPPETDLLQSLVEGGGDIFVILPKTSEVKELYRGKINFFDWLPIELKVKDNEEGRNINLEEVPEEWQWYFNENFKWQLVLEVEAGSVTRKQWREKIMSFSLGIPSGSPIETPRDYVGVAKPLATNRIGENIALQVMMAHTYLALSKEESSIYLLPLKDNWTYRELVRKILEKKYGRKIETKERPYWLKKYYAPREKELRSEIRRLENRIDENKEYKNLLFQKGEVLQSLVYKALREIGFKVMGERKGRRDGTIELENMNIILEIHGTENNVSRGKARELQDWVEEAEEKEVNGLIVANPFCEDDPKDRDRIPHDVKKYLKERNLKVLTTLELYKMITGYKKEKLTKKKIKEKLTGEKTIIKCDTVTLEENLKNT